MTDQRASLFLLLWLSACLLANDGLKDDNYRAALDLLQKQQFGPARSLLTLALARYPNEPAILLAAAQAADGAKDPAAALASARRCVLQILSKGHGASQVDKEAGQQARKLLQRLQPAVAPILDEALLLRAEADKTRDETERAILMMAYAPLATMALGALPASPTTMTAAPAAATEAPASAEPEIKVNTVKLMREIADHSRALGYKLGDHAEGATQWPGNGHWYKYFAEQVTWDDAAAHCKRLGGHLATISSKEENAFLYVTICRNQRAWLGATDRARRSVWKWVTGEPMAYENWGVGEPNNAQGEDVMEMPGFRDGRWNDIRGSAILGGYVCEWPK